MPRIARLDAPKGGRWVRSNLTVIKGGRPQNLKFFDIEALLRQSVAMPRVARLDTPGLLHHVMIRGIERRRIFKDNEDHENLIERLSKLLPKTKIQC